MRICGGFTKMTVIRLAIVFVNPTISNRGFCDAILA